MTKEEMLKDDFVATHYGDRARNWIDPAFMDGAEWMQENIIEKAVEWLKENLYTESIFEYDTDTEPINYICISSCNSVEESINKFKQAMEERI